VKKRLDKFQLDYKFPHVKIKEYSIKAVGSFQLDYKFPHVKIGAGGSLVK